jgi:hypothetical protein
MRNLMKVEDTKGVRKELISAYSNGNRRDVMYVYVVPRKFTRKQMLGKALATFKKKYV